MKVVWLCSLPTNFIRRPLNFINNNYPLILAPWITILINEIKKRKDIELHVISSYNTLIKDTEFIEDGIHYYLLSLKVPLINRGYPHLFKYYTNYSFISNKVKMLIDRIKPDIVNLHGTENDLSPSIIDITYPKLVTIQGFMHDVYKNNPSIYFSHKLKKEKQIFLECTNFGVRAQFMLKLIKNYNKNANFYWFYYPFIEDIHSILNSKPLSNRKKYDIIFAARLHKDKGIEDIIDAILILKKTFPNILLTILGKGNKAYIEFLLAKIKKMKLEKNIVFQGFLKNRNDVYSEIINSKLLVLPTYHDVMPGTIIESLLLGTPVVSYDIEGVSDFNRNSKIITLVAKGDIEKLANAILALLNNTIERKRLAQKAQKVALKQFDNELNLNKIINTYKKIINEDFHYEK